MQRTCSKITFPAITGTSYRPNRLLLLQTRSFRKKTPGHWWDFNFAKKDTLKPLSVIQDYEKHQQEALKRKEEVLLKVSKDKSIKADDAIKISSPIPKTESVLTTEKEALAKEQEEEERIEKEIEATFTKKTDDHQLHNDTCTSEIEEEIEDPDFQSPEKKQTSAAVHLNAVVFDTKGKMKLIEQEMKKSEFCSLHALNRRDLKIIDSDSANEAPSFSVRDKAIIVNLAMVRALIKCDSVYIFHNPKEVSHELQSFLMHELEGAASAKDPLNPHFELRILEAILVSVLENLQNHQDKILPQVAECVELLNTQVHPDVLKNLLVLKNEIRQFEVNVDAVIGCISKLLSNNEDLTNIYLSDKANQKTRPDNHEVEWMLEHYLSMFNEISSIITTTLTTIKSVESLIQLTLDTQRNRLIMFDLRATVGMLAIGTSTFITSIWGMNIYNGQWDEVEEGAGKLEMVAGSAMIMGFVLFGILFRKLALISRSNNIGSLGTSHLKIKK